MGSQDHTAGKGYISSWWLLGQGAFFVFRGVTPGTLPHWETHVQHKLDLNNFKTKEETMK